MIVFALGRVASRAQTPVGALGLRQNDLDRESNTESDGHVQEKPERKKKRAHNPKKRDRNRSRPDRQVLSLENRLQNVVPAKLVAQVQSVRTPTKPIGPTKKTLAQQNGQSLVRGAAASPLPR